MLTVSAGFYTHIVRWMRSATPPAGPSSNVCSSGPQSVGELAREFPVTRPAISQHLGVLKKARLVFDRPIGTKRLYGGSSTPAGVDALRSYFDQFWTHALAAFKKAAEERHDGKHH